MYKVITLLKRRPGVSVEHFQQYWLQQHAPLAAAMPRLRRYVQSHALVQGYAKGELPYDGISEMWFDTKEDYAAAQEPAFMQRLAQDHDAFVDPSMRVVMPVDVHVIVDGAIARNGVKNIEFVNSRPGMPLAAFRRYWQEHHGPLAAGIALMRRYEQNHLCLDEYNAGTTPRYDGLAISWFDSTADMKQGTKTEVYARTRADEANFLPDGHLPFIVTREHVILDR